MALTDEQVRIVSTIISSLKDLIDADDPEALGQALALHPSHRTVFRNLTPMFADFQEDLKRCLEAETLEELENYLKGKPDDQRIDELAAYLIANTASIMSIGKALIAAKKGLPREGIASETFQTDAINAKKYLVALKSVFMAMKSENYLADCDNPVLNEIKKQIEIILRDHIFSPDKQRYPTGEVPRETYEDAIVSRLAAYADLVKGEADPLDDYLRSEPRGKMIAAYLAKTLDLKNDVSVQRYQAMVAAQKDIIPPKMKTIPLEEAQAALAKNALIEDLDAWVAEMDRRLESGEPISDNPDALYKKLEQDYGINTAEFVKGVEREVAAPRAKRKSTEIISDVREMTKSLRTSQEGGKAETQGSSEKTIGGVSLKLFDKLQRPGSSALPPKQAKRRSTKRKSQAGGEKGPAGKVT